MKIWKREKVKNRVLKIRFTAEKVKKMRYAQKRWKKKKVWKRIEREKKIRRESSSWEVEREGSDEVKKLLSIFA